MKNTQFANITKIRNRVMSNGTVPDTVNCHVERLFESLSFSSKTIYLVYGVCLSECNMYEMGLVVTL